MESGKDLFYFWGKNIAYEKEVTYHYSSRLFILQNIGNVAVLGHLVDGRAICNAGNVCSEGLQEFRVVLVCGWALCVGL